MSRICCCFLKWKHRFLQSERAAWERTGIRSQSICRQTCLACQPAMPRGFHWLDLHFPVHQDSSFGCLQLRWKHFQPMLLMRIGAGGISESCLPRFVRPPINDGYGCHCCHSWTWHVVQNTEVELRQTIKHRKVSLFLLVWRLRKRYWRIDLGCWPYGLTFKCKIIEFINTCILFVYLFVERCWNQCDGFVDELRAIPKNLV